MGCVMKFGIVISSVVGVMLSTGAALAGSTCADLAATPDFALDDSWGEHRLDRSWDLVIGDKVIFMVEPVDGSGGSATVDFLGSTKTMTISGSIPSAQAFEPITVTSLAGSTTAIINLPTTGLFNVYITCEVGGPDDPDEPEEPQPNDDSADLTDIQNTQGQLVSAWNGSIATELAAAGLDMAFAPSGGSGSELFGYSGVVVDATPEPLEAAGFLVWAGGKGLVTLSDTDTWSGGQGVAAAGVNYRLNDRLVLGTFASLEAAFYRLDSGDQELDTSGATLGLLAAYRLDEMWQVQIIGHLTRLGYEVSSGAVTGTYDATRAVLSGSMTGSIPLSANIDFLPSLSLAVLHESQAGYTDSASTVHDAATFVSGHFSGGGKLMFYPESGPFTYSAGAYGDYLTSSGVSARFEVGANASLGDTTHFSVTGGLSGIGTLPAGTLSASLQGQF